MKIVSLAEAPKVPLNIEGYFMYSSSSLEVIHLCLQPGQDIPKHANSFDVVACLIKGDVSLFTGENKTRLELYDMVEIEKNADRGFENSGTDEARLLIMKKL
jgi:quercetin dioxygenase-like cupin family protein